MGHEHEQTFYCPINTNKLKINENNAIHPICAWDRSTVDIGEVLSGCLCWTGPVLLLQDMQIQMDEDVRRHEELREQYSLQERRFSLLQTEIEEVRSGLEASERSRKLIEQELVEVSERHNELKTQVNTLPCVD